MRSQPWQLFWAAGSGLFKSGEGTAVQKSPLGLGVGIQNTEGNPGPDQLVTQRENLTTIATQGKIKWSIHLRRAHTRSCSPTCSQVLTRLCFCTSQHGPQYFPMEPEAYQFSTGLPPSTKSSVLCVSAMSTQPGVLHHICVCTLSQDCTQQQRNRPCVLGTFSGADTRTPFWRKLPQKSGLLSSMPSQQETDR